MLPSLILIREIQHFDKSFLGTLYIMDFYHKILFKAESLERAWIENKNGISCVPPGEFSIAYERSAAFKKELWELKGVSNRNEVKFHAANFWYELKGCIALGDRIIDMDADGVPDVQNSRKTMTEFENVLMPYKWDTLKLHIYQ